MGTTERRATSETGGQKGRKPECYSLLPVPALAEVARTYNYGAQKYAPDNWRRGYPYSWSLDALLRHVLAFLDGEDRDPESGCHHLAHAVFHCLTLMTFQFEGMGTDDRPKSRTAREPEDPPRSHPTPEDWRTVLFSHSNNG